MVYLFFIFLIHFFVGQLIEVLQSKVVAFFFAIILIILVYYFTLGLEYTADYKMYYYFFKDETEKTDYVFRQLTKLYKFNHLNFHDLFVTHIIVSVILYYIFIIKFNFNFYYIFLVYFVLDYVHYSNQIRYFLGFPIMLLAFYNLYKTNIIRFLIFAALAVLSHSGLLVLLTFVPIYFFIKSKYYIRVMLFLSILCFIIVYLFFSLGLGADIKHFGEYFAKDGISSIGGGVFKASPYVFFMILILWQTRMYLKNNSKAFEDKEFVFLYKLTFYTIIFIPASFFIQITGQRYVMPFVIVYVIYYLYMLRDQNIKYKVTKLLVFSIVCFFISLDIYILPDYILKENLFVDELKLMLKSISYLDYRNW